MSLKIIIKIEEGIINALDKCTHAGSVELHLQQELGFPKYRRIYSTKQKNSHLSSLTDNLQTAAKIRSLNELRTS